MYPKFLNQVSRGGIQNVVSPLLDYHIVVNSHVFPYAFVPFPSRLYVMVEMGTLAEWCVFVNDCFHSCKMHERVHQSALFHHKSYIVQP